MRHSKLIIASTVLVFIMATALAFVWLFKVRYIEVDVFSETTEMEDTYEIVNGIMEENYKGKSFFSISEEEIFNRLTKDPYLKVNRVKKIFPDRIQISVEKRVEQFALFYDSVYYVTDSEYFILRKTNDKSLLKSGTVEMYLNEIQLDESTLVEGSKMGYRNSDIVGYMTEIFSCFSDGINLVDKVTVMGRQSWIRFDTKTGVKMEFSFAKSNPSISDEDGKREALSLIAKVPKVEEFYESLTEKEKSSGYILVYTKSSGEITIEHEDTKVEVD